LEQTIRAVLAISLLFTSPAFATVEPIHKGDTAPYDGFIFDNPAEADAEQDRADAAYYKDLSEKQAEKIQLEENESKILDDRLQLYIKESNTLAKDKANSDFNEKLLLFGSFSLGCVITTLIVRNVRQ